MGRRLDKISNSRPPTYLENQGDHLISYGLIKDSVKYNAEKIGDLEESIYQITIEDSNQEELKELQQKKQHYREQLFTLLKAVLVLNDIEQEQTSTTSSETLTSSSILIRQNTTSNFSDLSPQSIRKRNNNLDKVVDKITTALAKYEEEKKEYLEQKKIAEEARLSLPENYRFSKFFKKSLSDALGTFNVEKDKIVGDISEAIMLAFNNVPGITSRRNENHNPEELIKKELYYHLDVEKGDVEGSMGEAKIINSAINCISKIRDKSEIHKSGRRNTSISLNDDPTYDQLIYSIHNCFFYPKSLKKGKEIENDSDQETSSDEKLEENIAKYFFLLTVSYPFFATRKISGKKDSLLINKGIYDIIEDFCSFFSKKTGSTISEESIEVVKGKYDDLHRKLSQSQITCDMDITPFSVGRDNSQRINILPLTVLDLDPEDKNNSDNQDSYKGFLQSEQIEDSESNNSKEESLNLETSKISTPKRTLEDQHFDGQPDASFTVNRAKKLKNNKNKNEERE